MTVENTDTSDTDTSNTDAAPGPIETLRAEIDALDETITRLVAERAQLSVRIQAARVSAGGTRMELGRERVIIAHYRAALGHDGPNLAEAILRVCRGSR